MANPTAGNRNGPRVVPTQDARQGESTGHVRYVLQASLVLAVIAGVLLLVYFA